MVEAAFLQEVRDDGTPPRHFGVGKLRIVRCVDRAEVRRQCEGFGQVTFAGVRRHVGNFSVGTTPVNGT
jgi:hypothetical protein